MLRREVAMRNKTKIRHSVYLYFAFGNVRGARHSNRTTKILLVGEIFILYVFYGIMNNLAGGHHQNQNVAQNCISICNEPNGTSDGVEIEINGEKKIS